MFSIVIPLYNKSHTIERTLNSVLCQTFTEFEIVIINDGSTDDGVQKIIELTSDDRIKITNQENQGVSVARNNGIKNSKFEYIAFLDGDDEWLPEYLSKMKEAIEMFPESEMFCCAGFGRNVDGAFSKRQINKYDGHVLPFDFFENPHVFLHIGSTVVTKKLFNLVKGFPVGMKRNEDFAFLYSASLFTKPIYSGFNNSVYVGGVQGQATGENIYDNINLLNDVINRYNVVYDNWVKSGSRNNSFITFMKYELRHIFMINIYNKEFKTNIYFLKKLNPVILTHLNFVDRFFLKYSYLEILGIFYFKMTKVFWLLNGYQRVK